MPDYERCPFCDGSGRRVVAPPKQAHGGQLPGAGPQHGYIATYAGGCRCDLCRAAKREYERARYRQAKSAQLDGQADG